MKESVFDVLMYLFESYMDEDNDTNPDREELQAQLVGAGFSHIEIEKAFSWLDDLSNCREMRSLELSAPKAIRLYDASEIEKLDSECRGFLLSLEQTGVLSAASRELVIDRVMALDTVNIDLEQLQWIILMVLFNVPGEETAYHWLEELVFENTPSYLH